MYEYEYECIETHLMHLYDSISIVFVLYIYIYVYIILYGK